MPVLAATIGCARPAGPVFPPLDTPLVWPAPPATPRIRYIGALSGDADLRPARSGWEQLGVLLGGPKPVHSFVSPIAVWMPASSKVLLVADPAGQVVHRLDLEQRMYTPIFEMDGNRLSTPVAVVGDTRGVLYVADRQHRAIHRFAADGRWLSELPCEGLADPSGLAYDARTDVLYVTDVGTHRVLLVSPQGRLQRSIGGRGPEPGAFNFPIHPTVDGRGRVLVTDSLNHRVQRFRPDGSLDLVVGRRGTAPGDFALPKGVAVDSEGHIYVVDARFENVQIFDDDGSLLMAFGNEGGERGQFWLPAGIFIDATDRIFVADTYNRRVQVFQYLVEQERPI